jgi:glycosyltransferase involved in cell wall biosynthesis
MRIAWVTPFLRYSAIGRFSASVTAELAMRGHQVHIIRSEAALEAGDVTHETRLRVTHWREIQEDALRSETDLAIINIGNNYPFHAGIFRVLELAPCLGIFHDFSVIGLFDGWAEDHHLDETAYIDEVVRCYGPGVQNSARLACRGALPLSAIAEQMPMTEWVAQRCAGALAHANFYADRLRAACPGPVAVAPLTIEPRGVGPLPGRAREKVVVTTVGEVNVNKCVDTVIEAIGGSPALCNRVLYHVVGAVRPEERERLERVANRVGYHGLSFDGAVEDDLLVARLEDSDIMCCLRKPVLEGASGSAIEALQSGRPTIVANVGFYAELPDNLVFKVPADVPLEDVRRQLERLVGDEALRRRVGARAQPWAMDRFNAKRYAARLERLARKTAGSLRRHEDSAGVFLRAFRWWRSALPRRAA